MSGFYDDASWVLIPEGIKEDVVYAQKPTDGLGDLTFTRASDATRTNSAGVIERTPWNLLTFSEDFSNAVWSAGQNTITANVATSPIGLNNADRLTPNTNNATHFITANQSVSFVSGNSYTISVYAKANGYNFLRVAFNYAAMPIDNRGASFDILNGTVGQTQSGVTAQIQSVGSGWYRCSISRAATATAVDTTPFFINSQNSDSATSVTFTGDGTSGAILWGAQLVEGTDAKPYFATTNRQDVPRLDYRNADGSLNSCPRLLLEPQRTNSIRNSTMVGAVAGSPGTLPTNWSVGTGGLTQTVVGVGAESGLQYIDLRFNGTATTVSTEIRVETTTQIAASNGQTWSNSVYAKIISGSITSYIGVAERTSAGGFVVFGSQAVNFTSALARYNYIRTLSGGATVGVVQPVCGFNLTIGATYDFTIRIAAPQMELGAYATTFIPTTTAAVTRLVDVAQKAGIGSILGGIEGTIFLEWNYQPTAATTGAWFNIYGVGTSNIGFASSGANSIRTRINLTTDIIAVNPTNKHKAAFAFNASGVVLYINGSAYSLPNGGNQVIFGLTDINVSATTGGIERLANVSIDEMLFFPTRLTNARLAEMTTI
jgi:hypothetical protein